MNCRTVRAGWVPAPRNEQAVRVSRLLRWVSAAVLGIVIVALMPASTMSAPVAHETEPLGAIARSDESARPRDLDRGLDTVIEEVHAKLAAIRRRPNLQADGYAPTAKSALAVAERFRHVRAEMAGQLRGLRQRLKAAERTMWQLWPNDHASPNLDHGLIGLRWPTGDIERRPSR
ncbi:MAG: hypothetical protein OET79_06025 [Nitrospirota bacterium]|nr:hypothetical protein [Nitrospirota bacterium]